MTHALGKSRRVAFVRLFTTVRTSAMLVLVGVLARGQEQDVAALRQARIGFPWDWSHQHVIFTNTTDLKDLENVGQDPRLLHQWLRRNLPLFQQNMIGNFAEDSSTWGLNGHEREHRHRPGPRRMKRDWNTNLGNSGFVNANTYPAKYTFDVNATPSCTADYVVFPTGASGSSSQASVLAFNELYSTQGSTGGDCAQNGPSVDWSYFNAACPATSSSDPVKSSPALSLDGTKVAWVTTTGKVQVLKIGATGSNGAATTAGATNPPLAVCIGSPTNNAALGSVTLSGAPTVSNSSVFVDSTNDIGYVGDDSGELHKLTPFFKGSLAEVTTGGWPVTVSSATTKILTAPVLDSTSNNIYIGDNEVTAGNLFYVRLATGSVGTCNPGSNGGNPPCLGGTTLAVSTKLGLMDAPLVDSANEWVYTQSSDVEGINAKVFQADPTLTTVSSAKIGHSTTNNLYSGDFDNTYYTSGPTNTAARYYVCGFDTGGDSVLYQFGFSNITGHLNSSFTTSLAVTSANNTPCSPLTELYNPQASGGAEDWLFLSVADHGTGLPCNNSPCVFQINITNAPATLSIGQTAQYSPNRGTSGLVVDNVSALSQTSNIYFVTLGARVCTTGGNGACATKLQQSNLH
jgi:hypothetical protein